MSTGESRRINRPEFLEMIATQTGLDIKTVRTVVSACEDTIVDLIKNDNTLMLYGFGKFYPKIRAGHPVQFAGDGARVEAYPMLKFSASSNVSEILKKN